MMMVRVQKLVASFCASKVIYNSYFLKHNLLLPGVPSSVVHDRLPDTLEAIEANNFTEKPSILAHIYCSCGVH
jgi:hypothetical protein